MKKLLLSLSVVALLAVSCKKDKDDEPKQITPTKENLIGTYKITAMTMQNGTSPAVDFFNTFYDACERDDTHKLNADNTYVIEDAGTQCSPRGGYDANWSFVNASTIEIEGETGTITSWDGKTLMVKFTDNSLTGTTTFVRQ